MSTNQRRQTLHYQSLEKSQDPINKNSSQMTHFLTMKFQKMFFAHLSICSHSKYMKLNEKYSTIPAHALHSILSLTPLKNKFVK